MEYTPVPFDLEVEIAFKAFPQLPQQMTEEMVPMIRSAPDPYVPPLESLLKQFPVPVTREDIDVPGEGAVKLSVFRPVVPKGDGDTTSDSVKKCIYFIHGGGLVLGNRTVGVAEPLQWALDTDAIVVSVEYRLAPEHRYPAAVEDCYAGLCYVASHAAQLRIDPAAIMITGFSAGSGLSAATALMARDRDGPRLKGMCLIYPMLDDRDSISKLQYPWPKGSFTREAGEFMWRCYLGDDVGTDAVDYYGAPARATDLSGLPEAFVDVASAEPFRDECVQFASGLWRAGVQCELYVAPGGMHGYDGIAPESEIARKAKRIRSEWVTRVLGRK